MCNTLSAATLSDTLTGEDMVSPGPTSTDTTSRLNRSKLSSDSSIKIIIIVIINSVMIENDTNYPRRHETYKHGTN